MISPVHISEGLRIYRRSRKVKKCGFKEYKGSSVRICRQIVEDCWNKIYFQASTGHFCEFYTRDFGWCADSLLKLGYRQQVISTLKYALDAFEKHGAVTTAISPEGRAFDFPVASPDSLPFLIRSINRAKAWTSLSSHKSFLNKEVGEYSRRFIDQGTMLIKRCHFSSIKDLAKRKSSCYDNTMLGMLSEELKSTPLINPFRSIDYKGMIKKHFWINDHFLDDLSGNRVFSSDAQLFPFWTGLFKDKGMLKKIIAGIRKHKLDSPFPLKYTYSCNVHKMFITSLLAKGYEEDSIWMHIGMIYLQLLKKAGNALFSRHMKKVGSVIEKHKTFLEVFTPDGRPFKTRLYVADEGMLWAANYLALCQQLS